MLYEYILAVVFLLDTGTAPVPLAIAKDRADCMQKVGPMTKENRDALLRPDRVEKGAVIACLKIELPTI